MKMNVNGADISIKLSEYIQLKKVLHHRNFTILLTKLSNLNFKFDTALEDSIHYLREINLFGNIMCKSVKLYFSVNTII